MSWDIYLKNLLFPTGKDEGFARVIPKREPAQTI